MAPSEERGATLYVSASAAETGVRLRDVLFKTGLNVQQPYPEVWAVDCQTNDLCRASSAIGSGFASSELDQITFQLASGDAAPTPSQLMHARSVRQLIAWTEGRWVCDLLAAGRLTTHFQPIVYSDDPSRVFAYECLLRAIDQDGHLVRPDRLIAAARQSGHLQSLDHEARMTAIKAAARRQLETCVFINFNPRFLEDPPHSWERTLEAAISSGIAPERFVFEVIESDEIRDLEKLLGILDFCREAGCRVALDDLGTGYNSLQLMSVVRPDFIKLDMELIRDVDQDAYKSCVAGKLLELARELNVYTVVEGVESLGEWQWSREHRADFAQGYLFARPAPDPPQPAIVG
jgi:EAL domain-containing protein (putative c-di-GMP-specific phosphodiesterase class I)